MMKVKILTHKPFRTPKTRSAAAAANVGERQVINPAQPLRESSVTPGPVLSPSATAVSGDIGGRHESSKILSPPREGTPSPRARKTEAISELPGQSSGSKGKRPCRSPSPLVMPAKIKVEVPDLSGTTVAEAADSSNDLVKLSPSPKRRRTIASVDTDDGGDGGSPRKRHMEASSISIKYEPDECDDDDDDDDDDPPTPVIKYEDSSSEDEDEDEKDPFLTSPDVQRHYDLGLDAAPIPFQQPSASSSFPPQPQPPPPRGVPFYHPNFPQRSALRCPNRSANHLGFELKQSFTPFNPNRWFYCDNGFICWADDCGVHKSNPVCNCEYPSRENMSTDRARTPRVIFYNCATKGCRFLDANWEDQLSEREVNEYYGRQIYPYA
ncbi:hypothetical protein F4814DRAFT_450288 [Daldinia grandis]|nr:hypothetical protein F4814DRAFT_450288 [Daldinia grandis]